MTKDESATTNYGKDVAEIVSKVLELSLLNASIIFLSVQ